MGESGSGKGSRGEPLATDVWVKRRSPAERRLRPPGATLTDWVLLVVYRDEGNEHVARLPLSSEMVAYRVEGLLRAARLGQRQAGQELYACVHAEWGRCSLVGRHPAWEGVLRFIAPLAVPATVELQ
jgi:hypothetical protein